jgi:hypothetical protein
VHERRERCTGIWCENLKERDHMEIPAVDGRIILKCILKNSMVLDSSASE